MRCIVTEFEPQWELKPLPKIPLPQGWSALVLLALLHVVTLARLAILNARNWPDGSECDGLRLWADNDRLKCEIAMLERELAVKEARFHRLAPKKRPEYLPAERLEILLIKTMRGINTMQLAQRFQVTVQSVRRWLRGVKSGNGVVCLPDKMTRYPDYLRHIIQQLKMYCPLLGRFKMADILARVGLHISASTVRRIIYEPPVVMAEPVKPNPRILKSNDPNHIWSADLTLVPTDHGFWLPVPPNAMPQEHPYCYHVLNVIDHFSRRYMGLAVFPKNPTAQEVVAAIKRICAGNDIMPRYFVLDRGTQFDCRVFRNWCQARGIKIRFGKIGEHGSIARVERFHRSMKDECTRRIIVPTNQREFEHELSSGRRGTIPIAHIRA
jgi:transposase InsO family protein/DNA-binding transcriptional regulator YiaG